MDFDSDAVTERDVQLDEVVAEYLRALEAGLRPDRTTLLARYPNLADALAEYFASRDRMEHWAQPFRQGVAPRHPPRACPHCHDRLEPGAAELFCLGCRAR